MIAFAGFGLTYQVVTLPAKIFARWIGRGIRVHHIRLGELLPVEPYGAFTHLDRITGKTDQTLDEVLGGIARPLEDDHVAALGMLDRGKVHIGEGNLRSVGQLVHQEEVPYEDRLLHTARRDLECLDQERADDDEQRDRVDERARELREDAPAPSWF